MRLYLLLLPSLFSVVVGEKERLEDGGLASKMRTHRGDHHVDGEALMGSRKEADAMGNLSTEDGKRRLRAVAKRMDDDRDGKVSKEELTIWIQMAVRSVDKEEADERMSEVDLNGDRKVTWEEYVQDAFPNEKPEDLDAEDKKLLAEDEKYFKAADLSGTGKLSRDQFAAFLTPENYEHMHDVLVELTTKEKDEDGDGSISLKEFMGEMFENPTSEWYKVEMEKFSNEFDLDKDGKLTGHEIVKWLIPNVQETAISEMNHIFERADIDKDGFLTYEEVENQYELFVASEATQYGEQLDQHTEL